MKFWVQFWEQYEEDGEVREPCGSDSVFILDGRNTLQTFKVDALNRMLRLRKVQPFFVGFSIMRGSRFDSSDEIYKKIYTKKEVKAMHYHEDMHQEYQKKQNNK